MNELLFIIQTLFVSGSAIFAWTISKEALIAFICLQIIIANLFVTKLISLFGYTATGADAFIVGGIIGFHLLQEFYGTEITKKTIYLSFGLLLFFLAVSHIHLAYAPSLFDQTNVSAHIIFGNIPRITFASLTAYFISQQIDVRIFSFLKIFFSGRFLPLRNFITASISQLIDTILFSFIGLWGIAGSLTSIIFISYSIKIVSLLIATILIGFIRKSR